MTATVAIMGDRFMLSEMFEAAIRARCSHEELTIRRRDLAWPDEPMEHGYAKAGLDGLKEYLGDPDAVVEFVGDADIFVTHIAPLSGAMMDRLPKLRLVAVSRGGPVNIDMEAARARKIRVVNTPGRNASAVAEFAIGAILAQTRNITRGHDALRVGTWRGDLYRADVTGDELSDMTVGVIGYGAIGTRVVRLLKAFGCRILVCDPYVQLTPEDRNDAVLQVSLERLLAESDVVTLHARVTPETTGMIGKDALARMKKGAYFINTARGPMVDYDALYEALRGNHLRGAMLETFAIEPPPSDWPLLKLENVTLTPHIAGASLKTVRIAAARGLAAPEARERHAHAPHRRRLPEDRALRRRTSGRGSAPLRRGRAAGQPVLRETKGMCAQPRLHERSASFDKLRMRSVLGGVKKGPHPELVEGRTASIPVSRHSTLDAPFHPRSTP